MAGNKGGESILSKAPLSGENHGFQGKPHPCGFFSVTISQRGPSSLCLCRSSSWLLLYEVSSIIISKSGSQKHCRRVREQNAFMYQKRYGFIFLWLESSLASVPRKFTSCFPAYRFAFKGGRRRDSLQTVVEDFVAKGNNSCRHDGIFNKRWRRKHIS